MFTLSIVFLASAVISGILSFGILEGGQVEPVKFIFLATISLFAISGLIGVFNTPWADVRPTLVLLDGRKTAPD